MSISLNKAKERGEKIGRILLTKGISVAPTMRVAVAIDISGSMSRMFSNQSVQHAFDQLMGVSIKFDDNGELDVFKFDDRCEYVGTADLHNYETYLSDNAIRARGGTNYSPIVDEAVEFFFTPKTKGGFFGFGKKTEPANNMPVLMLVLTDGEPSESIGNIERRIRAAEQHPIYWHFVGIGGNRKDFYTIAKLADDLDNVGEVYLPRVDMSDDEIYEQLICDELVTWIGKFNAPSAVSA